MKKNHKELLIGFVLGAAAVYVYEKYRAAQGQKPAKPLG